MASPQGTLSDLRIRLVAAASVGLYALLVGLATSAQYMFSDSLTRVLRPVATGLLVGVGGWAVQSALVRRKEIARLRAELASLRSGAGDGL